MNPNYYATRAQAAHAAAEAADDPRDKTVWLAAARMWESLAKPAAVTHSWKPHTQQLAELKRDAAERAVVAEEPDCGFSAEGYREDLKATLVIAKQPVTIEF